MSEFLVVINTERASFKMMRKKNVLASLLKLIIKCVPIFLLFLLRKWFKVNLDCKIKIKSYFKRLYHNTFKQLNKKGLKIKQDETKLFTN